MPARLRALVVSYAFPPVGGAGVQRAVKLVKYLPDWGVDAEVLTVRNPSVPITDQSFQHEIDGITVHRARTLEPGYGVKRAGWQASSDGAGPSLKARLLKGGVAIAKQLMVPDPQLLWLPAASAEMARLAADYDVVVITAPPFSQFLLGPVARLRKTAVVLDYRDEWSTLRTRYEMLQSHVGAWIGGPLERSLVRSCHAVVTATPAFRDNLLGTFEFLKPERVHAISNGYDSDDYPQALPEPPTDRLVLTYAGTIYRLTSPTSLLAAVRRLHERQPELAKLLRVRFLGRIVDTELPAFEGTEALGVERLGYVPHDRVLHMLAASHLVVCLLAEGTERIYPAKIFELMNLGRPVLSIAPPGALQELVEKHRLGPVFAPDDCDGLYGYLLERLHAFAGGERGAVTEIDHASIAQYHRRALAERWADALRRAVADARSPAS
jgi:glycosyltransferase involved in cell wall biosynthesis